MSAEVQVAQIEDQTTQVEEEYHREDKREHKSMDANLLAPKFNANLLAKTFGDNLSTGSADYRMYSTFLTASPGSSILS